MDCGRESGARIVQLFNAHGKGTIRWSELAEVLRCTDGSVFSDTNITRLFDAFDPHRSTSVHVLDFMHWLLAACTLAAPAPCARRVANGRHLVLNVDINKTIVMVDSATGKSMQDIANHVLALSAWGTVRDDDSWVCEVAEPSVLRPSLGLVSYAETLEAQLPGHANKRQREDLLHRFTHQGGPGEVLQSHCNTFLEALRLPREVVGTQTARAAGLRGGEVFIIPAFFELLLHLKRTGRSFCLVFRTFGTDLMEVVTEFNAFCEGRHPLFLGAVFDGRDGGPDHRISLDSPFAFGTFYRGSLSGRRDALIFGTLEQPSSVEEGLELYHDREAFPNVHIVSGGLQGIFAELNRRTSKPCTLALRDYFPFWRREGMGQLDSTKLNGGKLMLIDPRSSSRTHQVFFDDNILYTATRIVDVRHALLPSKAIPAHWVAPCHLVRAEPLESVTDRQYFVRHVERLSAAYERRLTVWARMRRLFQEARQNKLLGRVSSTPASPLPDDYDVWARLRSVAQRVSKAASFAEPQEEAAFAFGTVLETVSGSAEGSTACTEAGS